MDTTHKFVSGTRPITDAERKRDDEDRRYAASLQAGRRRATPSRQNYHKPGSLAHRRKYAQMVGSE